MALDKKNLTLRVITAVFWILVLIAAFYWGGIPFYILIAGASLLSFFEYHRMMAHMGKEIPSILCLVGGVLLFANKILGLHYPWSIILIPVIIAMGIQMVLRYPKMDFTDLGLGIFGLFYTFVFYIYFLEIRNFPNGFFWLMLSMVLIWIGDSSAFFVGSSLGKNKLSPNLSPKKSVEGAVGEVVFTVVAAVLAGIIFRHYTPVQGVFLGLLISLGAIFGDLLESSIKRSAGVKDSGNFLPGHGGILDRFDSALLVIPLVYFYILYVIFA